QRPPGTPDMAGDLGSVLEDFLRRSRHLEPDDLPGEVTRMIVRLGARRAEMHLADHDQMELRALTAPGADQTEPKPIDSTVAGRVFRAEEPAELPEGDGTRLLLPMINGSHRIGVLDVVLPDGRDAGTERWLRVADLVTDVLVAKSAYGDRIAVTQRRRPMALRAEAQRMLLPPLTLTSARLIVTGLLVPSYEVAGDLFDYAVSDDTLHFAVLDAMGHSLSATLTAAVAIAAYRNSRRGGGSLVEHWQAADDAVAQEFGGERFATVVFGELDLQTGSVRSISAGHPSALLVRDNRVVARCADDPTLPVGLGGDAPAVTETNLQPGDRLLLFTDGIVEARSHEGEFFGEEQLVEQVGRELDTGFPAPEAVRRIVRNVIDHQDGRMRDDATLVLVEWKGRDRSREQLSPPSP
ncbi:MAG: PP2C family protein-serine/threonine phosphatase, partial [Egibacteraceae bacterium]